MIRMLALSLLFTCGVAWADTAIDEKVAAALAAESRPAADVEHTARSDEGLLDEERHLGLDDRGRAAGAVVPGIEMLAQHPARAKA